MEDIILKSRYGEEHKLRRLLDKEGNPSNVYILIPFAGNIRIGYEGSTNLFIDPSGGPFMHIGSEIKEVGKVLKSIDMVTYNNDKHYALTFE